MKSRAAWVVVVLGLLAASADAAPILIVNGGILQGATGVVVGSDTYDVSFVDGSCAALFTGCDQLTDFTFQTSVTAISAAQALLDTVFIDGPAGSFDSFPDLTRGCNDVRGCVLLTPFTTVPGGVTNIALENAWSQGNDFLGALSVGTGYDTTTNAVHTYAVFTPADALPVPEPVSSLTLLALGGVALGCYRGRRRR